MGVLTHMVVLEDRVGPDRLVVMLFLQTTQIKQLPLIINLALQLEVAAVAAVVGGKEAQVAI
jgi:hypothetical protein